MRDDDVAPPGGSALPYVERRKMNEATSDRRKWAHVFHDGAIEVYVDDQRAFAGCMCAPGRPPTGRVFIPGTKVGEPVDHVSVPAQPALTPWFFVLQDRSGRVTGIDVR